jgi:hypothetical protein
MNNSFTRLLEGMIDALREEVIPHTEGSFARGQAFGVIFLLENLKLRASWSPAFLGEQAAAQDALADALALIPDWPAGAPRLTRASGPASEALRDAGDAVVAELVDWLGANPGPFADRAEAAVNAYLKRQLRHELTTSARPMFSEISLGEEDGPAKR